MTEKDKSYEERKAERDRLVAEALKKLAEEAEKKAVVKNEPKPAVRKYK